MIDEYGALMKWLAEGKTEETQINTCSCATLSTRNLNEVAQD
jgi:hypothetical protein